MKYRHKETGAIIDVMSKMSGAWEPLEAPKKPDVVKEVKVEDVPAQIKRKKK
jgi:hypothetical protein